MDEHLHHKDLSADVAVSLSQSSPDTAAPASPNMDRLQTAPTLLQKEQGNG